MLFGGGGILRLRGTLILESLEPHSHMRVVEVNLGKVAAEIRLRSEAADSSLKVAWSGAREEGRLSRFEDVLLPKDRIGCWGGSSVESWKGTLPGKLTRSCDPMVLLQVLDKVIVARKGVHALVLVAVVAWE